MTIAALIARLEREGRPVTNCDPQDVARIQGFNDGLRHAIAIAKGALVTEALRELRDAPAVDMRGVVAFDLSDGES